CAVAFEQSWISVEPTRRPIRRNPRPRSALPMTLTPDDLPNPWTNVNKTAIALIQRIEEVRAEVKAALPIIREVNALIKRNAVATERLTDLISSRTPDSE